MRGPRSHHREPFITRTTATTTTALLALLVVSACGGGSKGPSAAASGPYTTASSPSPAAPSPAAPSPAASDEPSGEPTPDAGSGAVPALGTTGAYTPPSTRLKLGDKALVPFAISGRGGSVGVTLTRIDTGTPGDLTPLDLGDRIAGMTPYYVHVTVTNESRTDFSFTKVDQIDGVYADSTEAQGVSVIGDFATCPNRDAGENFTATGATYDECFIALAAGSAKVTGAQYSGGGGEYADAVPNAPDYGTKPIVWQP